ncbi:hypothetical protein LCM4579_16725 [Ensifer sp. LCM 4579]|nr:hypothetical protein LCM4579_16725 [Ensifer sp. LCM 4579]
MQQGNDAGGKIFFGALGKAGSAAFPVPHEGPRSPPNSRTATGGMTLRRMGSAALKIAEGGPSP